MITLDGKTESAQPQEEPKPVAAEATPEPVAEQEPQDPVKPNAAPPQPPADFNDKLMRLVKMRADGLAQPLMDDRGRVLREPLDPDEAMRRTLEYLPRYLQQEYGPEAFRAYISGAPQRYVKEDGTPGVLPNAWVPSVGVVKSRETQEMEWRAKVGRENSPVLAAVNDFLVDPANRLIQAPIQLGTDVVVGGLKHLGALPPGARIDVGAKLGSAFSNLVGSPQDEETTRMQLDAIASTKSGVAKGEQIAAEFVGTAYGFSAGVIGKALGGVGTAAGGAGKALFGRVGLGAAGQAIGHGAGVFGAYEGIVAEPGKVVEGITHGAVAGAAMGFAQRAVAISLRTLFKTPHRLLGPEERATMDSLKKWAVENKVFAEKGETVPSFEKRVVDTWIEKGLPGAPTMPARKLIAASVRGGADAVGFSMLEQQFREDFIDAAFNGDSSKWNSVLTKFAGNFLGAAALRMRLSSIVPWQRKQKFDGTAPDFSAKEQEPQRGAGDGTAPDLPTDVPADRIPLLPAPKETRVEKLTREQDQSLAAEHADRWNQLFTGESQRETVAQWENVLGASLDNVIPLGWKPSEKSVRPKTEPRTFMGDQQRAFFREQSAKFETDAQVDVGPNVASIVRELFPQNSLIYKRLGEMEAGGTLNVPAKEAKKFVDYYARRADRLRAEKGDAAVQAVDSFVQKIVEANGLPTAPERGAPRSGPEGEMPGEPIGEPVTGTPSPTAEKREGPSPRKIKIELAQSGHSFTLEGETARPSPALREALGAPAEMPAKELVDQVEKASLVSALHSKSQLPGQEISIGIKATSGRGNEPGKLRRVAMGKLQESDLRSDPQWKDVDVAPARGKDALELEQSDVVQELRRISEQRENIEPADRSLLNASIEVLDTVAASNDQSVAETMAVAPKLVEAIAKGEPGAEKVLAESLTTKTPEKAIADAAKTLKPRPIKRGVSLLTRVKDLGGISPESWKTYPGEKSGEFKSPLLVRKGGMRWDHMAQRLAEEGYISRDNFESEFVDAMDSGSANKVYSKTEEVSQQVRYQEPMRRPGREPAAERAERIERERIASREAREEAEAIRDEAIRDEPGQADVSFDIEAMRRGESGHLDLTPEPGSPAAKAVEAAETALEGLAAGTKTGASVVRKAWNAFQQSKIQAVEDIGRREEAEIGRDATTATKRIQTQVDVAGLMDMRRMPREQLDSLSETVSDGIGGHASLYARAMDAGMAKHFGKVENLTPEQKEVVSKGRSVSHEIAKIAEDIGIEQTDHNGKNPRLFKAGEGEGRQVLVREPTPEWAEAMRTKTGPLWDAHIDWLVRKYDWTPEQAAKQFADARGLTSLDATEIRRGIPVEPEFLDVKDAGTVRLYEARPLEHAERMAFRASQILGARSVLPRFAEKSEEGKPSFATPTGLEPLPPTAQQFVDKVLNESGPDAAQVVADMVRAMHGLPTKPTASLFRPGEVGYQTARVVNGLFGLARASALTMSAPMNLAEPLTNIAHFGASALRHGYRETIGSIARGEFAELHRQGVADGFIADTKLNDPWRGDTSSETVVNSLKKAGEILTAPLRMTQDVNEAISYVAARERLAEMKAGNGSKADANALSLLGFNEAQAAAIMRGEGTPAQYERYQRNIVGELAGGKSQRAAQKSSAGLSPTFNSFVWFTNFFQARSRVVDRMVRDIAALPASQQLGQAKQLATFLVATGLGGLAGNVIRQFLTGGSDGVEDYLREKKSGDWWDVTANIGGLISSGVLGGIGQPIAEAFGAISEPGEARGRIADAGIRMLGPLDTVLRMAEGKWTVPAVKAVNEGLFGAAVLAITDKDVQLDNAQDSYYRWLRDNRPKDFNKRRGGEEGEQFREAMRAVIDRVAAGESFDDQSLVDAVIEAEAVKMQSEETSRAQTEEQGGKRDRSDVYKDARASVVSSLRSRKILPEPGKFTTKEAQSLERHLGEKNLQTLRNFDEVLELLAKRVHSANLRGDAEERKENR